MAGTRPIVEFMTFNFSMQVCTRLPFLFSRDRVYVCASKMGGAEVRAYTAKTEIYSKKLISRQRRIQKLEAHVKVRAALVRTGSIHNLEEHHS